MSSNPATDYAGAPLPEVQVFSNNLLSADTTEKVLNALNKIDNIRQINMTGKSLSEKINSGPGKGHPNNHTERKVINVCGREVELTHLVGAFYIELEVESEEMLNFVVTQIDEACKETIPLGFDLKVGRYLKYKPTLTDYKGE